MFESEWNSDMPVYFVNVIENRAASNKIAAAYNVRHESPQLLVIRNGHCVYNSSHSNIDAAKVLNVTSEPL